MEDIDEAEFDKWLTKKILSFRINNVETLINLLENTNEIILKSIESPNNKTIQELLKSCQKANSMFINKIKDDYDEEENC